MTTETTTPIQKSKPIHFLNGITHDIENIQDKINYFVDCLELFSNSHSFPLSPINLDSRLLCLSLYKLITSDSAKKYGYIYHYYYHYQHLLIPNTHINKPFSDLLEKLNNDLKDFERKQPWKIRNSGYDPTQLRNSLENVNSEFEHNYFKHVIKELKKAIFCTEHIYRHKHIEIIEECTKIIIVEFCSIGYKMDKIKHIFDEAITNTYENIDSLRGSPIYEIPVPEEIFKLQKTISFTKYKNKVKKYLKASNLESQFNNLMFIHRQAQHQRDFIFRIDDLSIESDRPFVYDGIVFSRSLKEKYVTEKTNSLFNEFFNHRSACSFCEVSVVTGSDDSSLRLAIRKVNEALNYLQYHNVYCQGGHIKLPRLYLSNYIRNGLTRSKVGHNTLMHIRNRDFEHFKDISELEPLKKFPIVNHYFKLDKIFFEAFSAENDFNATSQLWRYCEALFEANTNKKADDLIQILVNYYTSKSGFHIFIGVDQMISSWVYSYLHSSDEQFKVLEMERDTFVNMAYSKLTITERVKQWSEIINHPLINKCKKEAVKLSDEEVKKEINNHYYKILKSANIQRNLFQHSNITIDELKNIWHEQLVIFVGTLRTFLIQDLKKNPTINKIEDLFPDTVVLTKP